MRVQPRELRAQVGVLAGAVVVVVRRGGRGGIGGGGVGHARGAGDWMGWVSDEGMNDG